MWCPDGFVLLEEILNACFGLSSDQIREMCKVEVDDQSERDVRRQKKACIYWIFLRFVERNEGKFYAALPNGRAVRVSVRVTELYFPLDEKCPASKESVDSFLNHASEPFVALDSSFFTIDVENNPDRLRKFSDYLASDIIKPLNGFPICWKLLQNGANLIDVIIKEAHDDQDKKAPPNKGGRMRVRNKAALEFRQTYPLGLESVSLSEAARALGYDRKTLREGLRETGLTGESPED